MLRIRKVWLVGAWISLVLGGSLNAQVNAPQNELAPTLRPKAFGTEDDTVTRVAALSFSGASYVPVAPLSRVGVLNVDQHFYATLDIPAGVIIDYVGFNNLNDGTPNVMAVSIFERDSLGNPPGLLVSLDNTSHNYFSTDVNPSALGILWAPDSFGEMLILDVEIAPSPNYQYFGWVEVWWHRTVSPAPGSADFNDVPTTHPFFQYVEALKASGITGGCQTSPPLYCPDAPVTRGQMAVFLAKALGLNWPL
jgi:hypothetical protein